MAWLLAKLMFEMRNTMGTSVGTRSWVCLVVSVIAALMFLPVAASAHPLTETIAIDTGVLNGSSEESGILSFKAIPYAAPPVGDLRWRPPQPASAWTMPRDARTYGPKCWGVGGGVLQAPGVASEDCLLLNVWTGAKSSTERRPVMVWIHSGGFLAGTASTDRTDGTALARKGVVVVTFNYRIAVLGFLAHPELDSENPNHVSGNYGLLDQIAALRWVKRNIAAFGGDPNKITIFGESAGAHAVSLQMSSPLSKGLFTQAIGESGAFWESESGPMRQMSAAEAMGVALQHKLGAADLAAMRRISAADLQAATLWSMATDPGVTSYGPVIDGYVFPQEPYRLFLEHKQNDVRLLAGWNGREDGPFQGRALPNTSAAEFRAAAEQKFGAARMPEFLKLYPADTDAQAHASAMRLSGDEVIAFPTWSWVQLQARTGRAPVWAYNFDINSKYLPYADHGSDVPYVFGTLPSTVEPKDTALSELVQDYWTNFAKAGDPNGSGLPNWPQYATGPNAQLMRLTPDPGASTDSGWARFQFLKAFRRGANN